MERQRTSPRTPVVATLAALLALALLGTACSSMALREPEAGAAGPESSPAERAPVTPAFLPTPLSDDLLAEADAEELALL